MDSHQSFTKPFRLNCAMTGTEVLTECFNDSVLPQSCRRAVLTLLPTEGDLQDIKNRRPVSLLCADYKLLS